MKGKQYPKTIIEIDSQMITDWKIIMEQQKSRKKKLCAKNFRIMIKNEI